MPIRFTRILQPGARVDARAVADDTRGSMRPRVSSLRFVSKVIVVLLVGGGLGAAARAQPPPPGGPAPASQAPAAQSYPAEQVEAGQKIFSSQCGFCHGRDAMGGESGPDLARSVLTADDVRGDKIAPLVRSGRADKGMPPFSFSDADLSAIVAFIHDQ